MRLGSALSATAVGHWQLCLCQGAGGHLRAPSLCCSVSTWSSELRVLRPGLQPWGVEAMPLSSDDCCSSAVLFTHLHRHSGAFFVISLSSQCRGRLSSSPHDGEESSCSREDEGAGGSRLLRADSPVLLCGCKFRIMCEQTQNRKSFTPLPGTRLLALSFHRIICGFLFLI